MTNDVHPSEIELLELVEGDLGDADETAAREHVATCRVCAEHVARLEQARVMLRAAPLLELPDERFRTMLSGLPPQEDEAKRRGATGRARRWLLVLAPVGAVAAVAAVLAVSLNGGGSGGAESAAPAKAPAEAPQVLNADASQSEAAEAAPPAAAAQAPEEAGGGATAAAPAPETTADSAAARQKLRSVGGTPTGVAQQLRGQGFDARVVDDTVEVVGANPNAVTNALEPLPDGDVPVVVVPGP